MQKKQKQNKKTKHSNNRSDFHLCYRILLFIMSHFFVKAIVFIELVKAIYFSVIFTFRILVMRLFKFITFFSVDLNT